MSAHKTPLSGVMNFCDDRNESWSSPSSCWYSMGIEEIEMHWSSKPDSELLVISSQLTRDISLGYLWWLVIAAISLHNCYSLGIHWRRWLGHRLVDWYWQGQEGQKGQVYTLENEKKQEQEKEKGREKGELARPADPNRKHNVQMLVLSSIYVVVCAIRALWPRKDVDRICFFDRPISTVFLGRSLATVAELCVVKQVSLAQSELASWFPSGDPAVLTGYRYYVSWISVAEVCSWIGIATKVQLWNAAEESIWMATALHLTLSHFALLLARHRLALSRQLRRRCTFVLLGGTAFVLFMCLVDIPMYLHRFYRDTFVSPVPYLGLADGIRELMVCQRVTRQFSVWWEDVPWMTAYFSLGVWISLDLVQIH